MHIRFFFNDTATTEIYTLSLHDALPISGERPQALPDPCCRAQPRPADAPADWGRNPEGSRREQLEIDRSEEHTSELQSRQYLVCRLLLEKKLYISAAHLSYLCLSLRLQS